MGWKADVSDGVGRREREDRLQGASLSKGGDENKGRGTGVRGNFDWNIVPTTLCHEVQVFTRVNEYALFKNSQLINPNPR